MKIVSKFTREIFSKLLEMLVHKKCGYDVDIQINKTINHNRWKDAPHLDVDAEINNDELITILKSIGLN